jgi:plasmid maintenance system antidote protein VapI
MRRKIRPTAEHKRRLLRHVKQTPSCWLWTACTNDNGYGRLRIEGQEFLAHRLSFAIFRGRDPFELDVCHSCDNPRCVNPKHLFLGTHLENMRDASFKGRWYGKGRGISRNAGEGNPMVKLSDADVKAILRAYAHDGISQREIGRKYGVSQALVSSIICRRSRVVDVDKETILRLQSRYSAERLREAATSTQCSLVETDQRP